VFKHEFDEEDETEDDNEYAFLFEKAEFDTTNFDFNDKGALLKRQRKILEQIEDQKKTKEGTFSPFNILGTGLKLWFIILCQGGKFWIAKLEKDKIVEHKSDTKYVQRKKQGKRQANFDSKSSCMTSVGSQMRRNNEKLHQEHIKDTLDEYEDDLKAADVIFLHAPGINKQFFVGHEKLLRDMRHKIRSLRFNLKKANFSELERALHEMIEIKIEFE
jgi:hypothetical protein